MVALLPPFLAESAYEWFFEELVYRHLKFLAQFEGWSAHIPFVHVDRNHVAYLREADRIEGARDGFAPFRAPFSMGPLGGAEAATCRIVAREYAVLAAHNAGDEVALFVRIGHALRIDDG